MSNPPDFSSGPRKSVDEILAAVASLRESTRKTTNSLRQSISAAKSSAEQVEKRHDYVEALLEKDHLVQSGSLQNDDIAERFEAVQKRLFAAGERLFGDAASLNDAKIISGDDEGNATSLPADSADVSARVVLLSEDIQRWMDGYRWRDMMNSIPNDWWRWRYLADEHWKSILSGEEYSILRKADTEAAFSETFYVRPKSKKAVSKSGTEITSPDYFEDHESLYAFPVQDTVVKVDNTYSSQQQTVAAADASSKFPLYLCCRACQLPLYCQSRRYKSECGWPAFTGCYFTVDSFAKKTSHLSVKHDLSDGMDRFEIICARCLSHLGHVFFNERFPGSERHCVNSRSLEKRVRLQSSSNAKQPSSSSKAEQSPSRTKQSSENGTMKIQLTCSPIFGELRDFKRKHMQNLGMV